MRLQVVKSSAVRRLGSDPETRMAAVQFTGGDTVYGYPNMSDVEIAGLLRVMQDHGSIGEFVSTVVKPRHDHERVSWLPQSP